TATATVHETSPVVGTTGSPWDRVDNWSPAEGDSMRVSANVNGVENTRFEGTIEDVDGSALDLDINVAGVDPIRRLQRKVSFDPQARGMPLPVESRVNSSVSATLVDPHVRHEWFVERALNEAGWYSTRQPRSDSALNVPFVGSVWDVHTGTVPRLYSPPGSVTYAPVGNTIGVSLESGNDIRWEKPINNRNQSLSFTVGYLKGGPAEQRIIMGSTDTAQIKSGFVYATAREATVRVVVRDTTEDGFTLAYADVPWNRDDMSADVTIERSTTYTRLYIDGVLEAEGGASTAGTFDRFIVRCPTTGPDIAPVIAGLVTGTRA